MAILPRRTVISSSRRAVRPYLSTVILSRTSTSSRYSTASKRAVVDRAVGHEKLGQRKARDFASLKDTLYRSRTLLERRCRHSGVLEEGNRNGHAGMASTVWVHGEFGCALCGVVSCGSAEQLKEHLSGSRHQKSEHLSGSRHQRNAGVFLGEVKSSEKRRESRKLHFDVRRPPAYEPVRGLWHPGTPSQPEEEALEGNWRVYAEMGWMPTLDKLKAPDVILGAAPVVSCQGTIHLRRPGKEDEEEEEAEPPDDMVPTSRGRPMLLGTWQLEHPEGHDMNRGMFPFRAQGAQGLTALAPAAMKVFPSSCGTRDYIVKQETSKEATKRVEEGSIEETEGHRCH